MARGGAELLGVAWSFTIPALAICILRIYVRYNYRQKLGIDDYFMAAAGVFSLFYTIMITVDVSVGFGKHLDEALQSHSARAIYVADIITWFVAFIYTIFLKLSITTFLLRLRPERYLRLLLWFTITSVLISLVYCTVVEAVRCRPLSKTWNKHEEGHCLPASFFLASNYMLTAVCTFSWSIYVMVPIILTWNVQMHPYTKRAIWCLISLGCIPLICSPLKIPLSAELVLPDLTWHETKFHIVLLIENNLGIIVASVPAIKPVIDRRWPHLFLRSQGSSYKYSRSRSSGKKSKDSNAHDEMELVETSMEKSQSKTISSQNSRLVSATTVISVT